MSCVQFTVNGKICVVDSKIPPDTSLNVYIRYFLGLPGTKAMCREGGCGACIVMVRADRLTSGKVETFHVNSCLVLVFSCNGWDITTVEGVGNRLEGYSEVQKRIVHFNATQCGYCTPGWVMSLTSLEDKHLTMAELEQSFGSNTCRCTGYRPLLDTIKSFAIDASPSLCQKVKDIEDVHVQICKKTNTPCERKCSVKSVDSDWAVIDKVAEVKLDDNVITLDFGNNRYYYKVYDKGCIFEVLNARGVSSYMFVDGDTGKGVIENFEYPRLLIDISGVKSLKEYYFDQNLVLGANISLEDCITIFQDTAKTKPEFAYLSEFAKYLLLVAHIPVRKIGSIAGNLMLKRSMPKYPSDIFLLFETVGATMTIESNSKVDSVTLTNFLDYDMTGKLITDIKLPPLSSSHIFRSYKIMPRHQNALAIVNAAFLAKLNSCTNVLDSVTIVYGNISDTFIHASKTEYFLTGKNVFNNQVLQAAITVLGNEVQPIVDPPKASPECRKKLAIGIFYKFILSLAPVNSVDPFYRSGGQVFERPVSSGNQYYETDKELYPLNEPLPKLEGFIQSSGEARYSNDIPPMKNEVFGAFVLSTIHSGEIDTIDAAEALKMDGVITIYTAKDIPGVNSFGFPGIQLQTQLEEILATQVKFYGQPVAIIVAKGEDLASRAAKKVIVTYKNVSSTDPVLTIDQAKRDSRRYLAGDSNITPQGKGTDVKHVIKGTYEIEAQYHYYMEPLTCVAIPVDDKLEIHDAGQWMDLTQICIAKCLNMKESDVFVKVRRIGGGFGGKISRNVQVATACAIVAKKLDVPCRFILPIHTNLTIAGRRLPCQCDYEVGVDDNGKVQYLTATLVEDVGCSSNEDILSYTVGGFPNCYDTKYFDVKTANVLTDLPSNTFARAPGTAEGISSIEQIMEHIAFTVNKDPTDVRLINMRNEDNDLPELINTLKQKTNYDQRVKDINDFNAANRWMKKAISISVMSFPVEYYGNYTAMVSIYRGDGSVTVTTGGIEMGQGVNTKAAQICAYELNIPYGKVSVLPSYGFVAANNVFSGSSIVSESVSYAIIKACAILKERLQPVKDKMPNATWEEIVFEAANQEIDLVAEYMMTDQEKDLKNYSAFAVVILEVQIDVLTGRFDILRVDILEDVGLSANPKLDVGQVEGGYIQGIGYYTSEKLVYDIRTGKLLTSGSLYYHVPLCLDTPILFNVHFRNNSKNPYGVLGSKACGEMGICTAQGILHVIKNAIYKSRKDSGYDPTQWIPISVPVDTESILKALDVKYTEMLITKP